MQKYQDKVDQCLEDAKVTDALLWKGKDIDDKIKDGSHGVDKSRMRNELVEQHQGDHQSNCQSGCEY